MADNIIRFNSRTFGDIKDDLINYISSSYPEVLNDFSDSSVGSMLIEVNAGVANNLAMNTDRIFQETQLEYAQKRSSILNIAKNMGFNIPPKRPSVTVVDFTVTVPVRGDSPDSTYYPVLAPGATVSGGGKVFETQEVIDWNSPVSIQGNPNREIIPNLDDNGIITSYNVTKREIVINGSSKIFKRVITDNDTTPFFSVVLPDTDVIGVESVVLLEGTNYNTNPRDFEFLVRDDRFFEVDYLAQNRVFSERVVNNNTLNFGDNDKTIKVGEWFDVTKKFIREFTENGYCKLTFGSGDPNIDFFASGALKEDLTNKMFLDNLLNNTALGEKLKPRHTLFVKYRVGGGSDSNIGSGVLNQMGDFSMLVVGSRQDWNLSVKRSLRVNNPIPAIGGNDGLSVDQIRNLIKYNFSAQNRNVTLKDYLLQVYKMPGRYGSPFRVNAFKENNKVVLSMLSIGNDGKLSNISNSLLKNNIAEYISGYRMVNDYVEIRDAKIINIAFDVDVYVDDISNNSVANGIISEVREFFDINKNLMDTDIYLGKLEKRIMEVNGVVQVLKFKAYNKVGQSYSKNVIAQPLVSQNTGEISLVDNTIYGAVDSMFEIKFPEKDVRVFLRKR